VRRFAVDEAEELHGAGADIVAILSVHGAKGGVVILIKVFVVFAQLDALDRRFRRWIHPEFEQEATIEQLIHRFDEEGTIERRVHRLGECDTGRERTAKTIARAPEVLAESGQPARARFRAVGRFRKGRGGGPTIEKDIVRRRRRTGNDCCLLCRGRRVVQSAAHCLDRFLLMDPAKWDLDWARPPDEIA